MRALLVEDDQKIADFVRMGLEEAGFAMDYAGNGEDGLHLALSEPYDVAIIDIMLPKLDGLELIAELRRYQKDPGLEHPPVFRIPKNFYKQKSGLGSGQRWPGGLGLTSQIATGRRGIGMPGIWGKLTLRLKLCYFRFGRFSPGQEAPKPRWDRNSYGCGIISV